MNLTELNSQFEVLFEDLATSGSKGLDAYETSLCFTYAQESITRRLASARVLDPISSLVKENEETTILSSVYSSGSEFARVQDPFFVLGYFLKSNVVNNSDISLQAVSMAFVNNSILSSDYKYPPKNLAYVVMGETNLIVFSPFNYDLKSLVTIYIEKPTPIILESLTGGDSIDGLTAPTDPVIESSMHTELVREAVQFAIEIYIGQQEKEVSNDSKGTK